MTLARQEAILIYFIEWTIRKYISPSNLVPQKVFRISIIVSTLHGLQYVTGATFCESSEIIVSIVRYVSISGYFYPNLYWIYTKQIQVTHLE